MKKQSKKFDMLLIIAILLTLIIPIIFFYGHYRFYHTVEKEVYTMFNASSKTEKQVTQEDLQKLPLKLQEYLMKIGIIGTCKDCNATIKQIGRIKTGLDKKWTRFTATQYMTANLPNFIWSARLFPIFIRDKSVNGQGEVKVNLFGLKTIAKSDNELISESALARCLGELLMHPVGFLSEAITWNDEGDGSLKAIIKVGNTEAEGSFFFNNKGLISQFDAQRYLGESLESFTGIFEDFKNIEGLLIPTKLRAIWNLKGGDFEYFNSTISSYKID